MSGLKAELIAQFNALDIPGMGEVKELYPLEGAFINLEYRLPGGPAKFWDDRKTYLGAQLERDGSCRCYGLAADETHLLVCEYGEGGSAPEVLLYKRWNFSEK